MLSWKRVGQPHLCTSLVALNPIWGPVAGDIFSPASREPVVKHISHGEKKPGSSGINFFFFSSGICNHGHMLFYPSLCLAAQASDAVLYNQ
jgi:hypothetical protein